MSEKFRKLTHNRSTVTVKFTTSQDAYSIASGAERDGVCVEPTAIESVTIVERNTIRLIPEYLAKRAEAAQAARDAAALVSIGPDPRD